MNDSFICRGLWKLGQSILFETSTFNEEHRRTIANIEGSKGNSFDLTALVTMVVPIAPDHLRGNLPKGYMRLWDGTGPSQSDP